MTVKVSKPAINVREELADLRKPTGVAGEAMLRAETPQEQFNLIGAGRRNILINGGMTVWQRGTSAVDSTNGAGSYFTADRWRFYASGGGAFTTEKSTGHLADTGHDNALKIAVTTADTSIGSADYYSFLQRVEAQDLQQLGYGTSSAKHITISFWVRASKAGTNSFFVTKEDTNTYRFVREFTINNADTWEYKTITIPPLTPSAGSIANDNGVGMQIGWILKYGSSYEGAPDVWTTASRFSTVNSVNNMDTVGNTFYLTGVQLELGKVATPFEHRSYGEELALCQRYYQSFEAQNGATTFGVAYAFNSTHAYDGTQLIFPTVMRAVPTRSTSGNWQTSDGTGAVLGITGFYGTLNTWGYQLGFSVASGLTQFRPYAIRSSNGKLNFDAEL